MTTPGNLSLPENRRRRLYLWQYAAQWVATLVVITAFSLYHLESFSADFYLYLLVALVVRFMFLLFAQMPRMRAQEQVLSLASWFLENFLIWVVARSDINLLLPPLLMWTLYAIVSISWGIFLWKNQAKNNVRPFPITDNHHLFIELLTFWIITILLAITFSLLSLENWPRSFYLLLSWEAIVGIIPFLLYIVLIDADTLQLTYAIGMITLLVVMQALLPEVLWIELNTEFSTKAFDFLATGSVSWSLFIFVCMLWLITHLDIKEFKTKILPGFRKWIRGKLHQDRRGRP